MSVAEDAGRRQVLQEPAWSRGSKSQEGDGAGKISTNNDLAGPGENLASVLQA